MRRWALVLVLGGLWPDLAAAQGPRPEDEQVSMLAGGVVSLATTADAAAAPLARVGVTLPVSSWEHTPRLHVQVDLAALPGEAVSVEDPQTFRSVEFRLAVCQPLHPSVYVDACLGAGFASRLPGDPEPRDKAVRWAEGHVRFGRVGRGWLTVGLARDQRLDGMYRWTSVVSGAIKLYEAKQLHGVSMQLVGDAVLGLDLRGTVGAARRDVIRVGMAVGL